MQALKTEAGFGSHAFGEGDDEGVDEGRGGCHGDVYKRQVEGRCGMVSFDGFTLADGIPIYLQILLFLKRGAVAGTIRDGDELPSRRVLSALLGVNPNTVQKAYRLLEEEGLIASHSGAKSLMVLDTCLLYTSAPMERQTYETPYSRTIERQAPASAGRPETETPKLSRSSSRFGLISTGCAFNPSSRSGPLASSTTGTPDSDAARASV